MYFYWDTDVVKKAPYRQATSSLSSRGSGIWDRGDPQTV